MGRVNRVPAVVQDGQLAVVVRDADLTGVHHDDLLGAQGDHALVGGHVLLELEVRRVEGVEARHVDEVRLVLKPAKGELT